MTDDIVARLRDRDAYAKTHGWDNVVFGEAADRIEKLEAALREIAAGYETPWSTSTVGNMLDVAEILSERIGVARKALEGKNEIFMQGCSRSWAKM